MPKNGRPFKYNKDFHPQDYIVQCKKGKTNIQIAAIWEVDRDNINLWQKRYKEFREAVKTGKGHARAFWINLAFMAMVGKASMNGEKVQVDYKYFNWIMMHCFGIGKEKKGPVINLEFRRLLDAAKQLENMPDGELIKLAEREIMKAKKS